jgi:hypothetical protein
LIVIFMPAFARAEFSFTDVDGLLTPALANALVETVGMNMDHRSYQPATPLATGVGLDVGIEVTLVQPPPSLATALGEFAGGASGGSSSSLTIPIVPSAKLHLHKGFGKGVDIGLSALPPIPGIVPVVGGTFLIGGDVKVVVWEPEEGPIWAIRCSYNVNNFSLNYGGSQFLIKTATITPQLVISKKLSFADPYVGLGYQYTYGSAQITVSIPELPFPAPAIAPVVLTENGSGGGAMLFGGLSMRIPAVGFKLTLEGSYSPLGMNSLGTKIGFEM